MAINGLFTYEDLYAQKYSNYHHRLISQLSSPLASESRFNPTIVTTTTNTIISSSHFAKLISSTPIESTTKLHKLADVIPFTYFHWILVLVAILLALTLIIVFICYCRTFVENYRNRRDSITSFYRNRTTNQRVYTQNIYQRTTPPPPTAPPPPPAPPRCFPTSPCPSKSLKSLDDQLYRQNVCVIDSPQIARHDLYLKEPLSTFTSSTPNLSSALPSRLSARSFDLPSNIEQLYESQRASMAMNDDRGND